MADKEIFDCEKKAIENAINAYTLKYSQKGRALVVPGLKSSKIGKRYIILKSGKVLLAVYNYTSGQFLPLTANRIRKYSKQCNHAPLEP
ncbi:MAG: hypothetical protein WCR72_07320 [Bacteroidota bacterium]